MYCIKTLRSKIIRIKIIRSKMIRIKTIRIKTIRSKIIRSKTKHPPVKGHGTPQSRDLSHRYRTETKI